MTISFIVTSYNYEKYIEQTIKSIQNQTYSDIEIIVVDDASTDNSINILEKFDGIKLIKHSQNKGQLGAIITGLKESSGEFISIIDSDDTIEPYYAEKMVAKLITNDIAFVNCNNNEVKILTPKNAPFGGWWWSPMSCSMFKKEFLTCIFEYMDINLWRICPDKFLFNLAHLQGNSMIIEEKLVNKREHENNAGKIKNRFWLNVKNNFIIRHEALKIIKDNSERKIIFNSYIYLFIQIIEKLLKH